MMDRIVRESERHMTERPERLPPRQTEPPGQLADAVAEVVPAVADGGQETSVARDVPVEPPVRPGAQGSEKDVGHPEAHPAEVRRLFEALGLTVSRLIRVRFGPVAMPPKVKRGMFLDLTDAQVRELLKWCELKSSLPGSKPTGRREEASKAGHPYRRRMHSRSEN